MGDSVNGPMINLCNSIIGVSVLAMPFCFSKCGIILGGLLLAICGLFTVWSCKMAIRAAKMTRSHSYETLALAVFGKPGKLIVELSIIGLNIGTCVAFFVIIGDLVPSIVAQVIRVQMAPETLRALVLILIGIFVVFPLTLLRTISSLSALSTLSLIFYVFLIIQMFFLSWVNLLGGSWWSHTVWWDNSGILKCLPIFALAYACHSQMFSIYSAIEDPTVRKMSSVINGAIGMAFSAYFLVSFFGYVTFCTDYEVKGDVLANFSLSFLSQLTRFGFAFTVMISFPLMVFPCRASLNSLLFTPSSTELHVQEPIPQKRFIFITIFIVGPTLTVAVLVPQIEVILALTGATVGVLISYVFPSGFFLKVAGSKADYSQRARVILCIGLCIMALSTIAVIADTSSSSPKPLPAVPKPIDVIKLPPPVHTIQPVKQLPGKVVQPPDKKELIKIENGFEPDKPAIELPAGVHKPKPNREDEVNKEPAGVDHQEPPVSKKPDIPKDNIPQDRPPEGKSHENKLELPRDDDSDMDIDRHVVDNKVDKKKAHEVDTHDKLQKADKLDSEIVATEEVKLPDKLQEPRDTLKTTEAVVNEENVHQKLQIDLSKLNERVEQLEEENKDLKVRQEVMERIQIDEVIKEVKEDLELKEQEEKQQKHVQDGGVKLSQVDDVPQGLERPKRADVDMDLEENLGRELHIEQQPDIQDEVAAMKDGERDRDVEMEDREHRVEDGQRAVVAKDEDNDVEKLMQVKQEGIGDSEGNIKFENKAEQEIPLEEEQRPVEDAVPADDHEEEVKRYKVRDLKVANVNEEADIDTKKQVPAAAEDL